MQCNELHVGLCDDYFAAADEHRSCLVTASKNPVYIIGSSATDRICGTRAQPWIIESFGGQRIKTFLIDFSFSLDGADRTPRKQPCRNSGIMIDKDGKKNTSICVNGDKREQELYTSTENSIKILFNPYVQPESQVTGLSSKSVQFMIKVTGQNKPLNATYFY